MSVEVNLDNIQADIKTIGEVFVKFESKLSTVYANEFDVQFPKGVQLDELVDSLEQMSSLIDELSIMVEGHNRGFYSILEAAREEVEKIKG